MVVAIRLMLVLIRMEGKCGPMGDEHKASRPTAMVHYHVRGGKEKGDDHTEVEQAHNA
jgi:hypothetical protein